MSTPALDQEAAIRDLIAFDGEEIQVGGVKVRAHVERVGTSFEASEHGLNNRDEELKATLIHRGKPLTEETPIIRRGKPYRLAEIEPAGEHVLTLTLRND